MKQNDLRVIRTKKSLSDALFNLLEKRVLPSITIDMICDDALVHRTTFYTHFYDKYDLLTHLLKSLSKEYFDLNIKERINSPFESISNVINSKISNISKKQHEDYYFNNILANHFVEMLQEDIRTNIHRIFLDSKVPNDLFVDIYGANLYTMMEWTLEKGIEKKPTELDQIFQTLLKLKFE